MKQKKGEAFRINGMQEMINKCGTEIEIERERRERKKKSSIDNIKHSGAAFILSTIHIHPNGV